jgi:hypothetical protein
MGIMASTVPTQGRRRRRKTNRTRKPTWRTIWHSLIITFLEYSAAEQTAFLARLRAEGREAHARKYERMAILVKARRWEPIHDIDFRDQKARKGDFFLRLSKGALAKLFGHEKDGDSDEEKDPLDALNFFLPSGRRGGQFLRDEKTGQWVEADALFVADFLFRLKQERWGFFYDERQKNGKICTKWKKLQVSKEAQADAARLGIEVERTPLQTLEVQSSPIVVLMLKYRFEALLAAGVPEREAEDEMIALFLESRPRLVTYMETRTGQKVVVPFFHVDSGKFHHGFYMTRVDENFRQIGVPQLGTTGAENVGLNSQLWAGYQMPMELFNKFRRRMLLMEDRYARPDKVAAAAARGATFDGRATDLGLSEELMMFFYEKDQEMGWGYWDRACAEYREALEESAMKKAAERVLKKKLRDAAARVLLDAAERDEAVGEEREIRSLIPRVRSALEKGLAASGLAGFEHREAMRAVTATFSLRKIAEAKPDLIELWEAAKAGLAKLLEFLRNLFKVSVPEVTKPAFEVVEAEAPEASIVSDPIAKERAADAKELAWLEEIENVRSTYPQAPVGPELEVFIANVGKGVSRGHGLRKSQFEAGLAQVTALAQWVKVEKARLAALVPPATSAPTARQTQDREPEGPPSAAKAPDVPVFDPENPICRMWFGLASAVLEDRFSDPSLPTRPAWIVEVAQWVAAEAAAGRFGSPEPAQRKFAVTSTQSRVAAVLRGVAKLSFVKPALIHLDKYKSPEEAIELAERKDVPPPL